MALVARTVLAAILSLSVPTISAALEAGAPYRISPGDTLEISIAAVPEGTQRALVQMDGTIVLREVGAVSVEGLTPAELQSRMEEVLPTKIYHFRLADGRNQIVTIKPEDVTAVVAEYRPIYVTGDVLTPGQQPFRPQMTVRQAVAVAGGFSLLRSRANAIGTDPADALRDYESLWTEYTREYFHSLRLRAEMEGNDNFDPRPPEGSPLPPSVAKAVGEAEAQALKTALSDAEQERAYLEKGIRDTTEQIEVLTKRQQTEEEAAKTEEEELARISKAFKSGNLTNERVADVRRSLQLASSRALETLGELLRTKRLKEDFARQIDRNANQRQIQLVNDLKDTNVRLADLSVKLRAASQRMRPGTGAAAPLPLPGQAVTAEVLIVRKVGSDWQRLHSTEDTEVAPGDTVEVRFGTRADSIAIQ